MTTSNKGQSSSRSVHCAPEPIKRERMAPPAAPLPLHFSVQTTSSNGTLTTINSTVEATLVYLDGLVQGFEDAINNRALSASAIAWCHLSDRYEMGSKSALHIDSAADNPFLDTPTGIEENLKELRMTCEKYPEYRMEFQQRTTEVDDARGKATTLCVLKVSGKLPFFRIYFTHM